MWTKAISALATGWVACAWCVAATADPIPQKVELSVARTVRDVVALDLRRIAAVKHDTWVLAEVRPARNSGRAFHVAGFEDPATGQFVVPRGSRRVCILDGQVNGVLLSDPTVEFEARYEWWYDFPLTVKGPRAHLYSLSYSPFARDGGTVVSIWNNQAATEADLPACFLIPAGWDKWVVPAAVAVARAEAPPAARPARPDHVLDALAQDNPFLAVDAFRALSSFPVAETLPVTKRALLQSGGLRQAMFSYCLLRRGAEAPARVEAVVDEVVGEVSEPARVHGLITALWIAELADEPEPVRTLARSCIRRIASRGGKFEAMHIPERWRK